MNKVILTGRLTKDPDIKYVGDDNKATMKGTIAVQRSYKDKNGEYKADFITFSAFGKTCEFIERYFHKGSQILIEGEWRSDSYEKDGTRIYTNECNVSKVEFYGAKNDNTTSEAKSDKSSSDDFVEADKTKGTNIPFFDE